MAFIFRRFLGHVGLLCLASSLHVDQPGQVFLQRASRHVLEPSIVDKSFLKSIADSPGDALVLLYSPSCPDSEWLMKKVWKTVAHKLEADSDTSVMTISDYGFTAPKPFEHWVNPAIFLARKGHKMDPIFFPNDRLQEYLKGMPSRPQDQQDLDFVEDLLVFAKGAEGVRIFNQTEVTAPSKAVHDVEELSEKMFKVLQDKWADPDYQKAQTGPEQAAPTASLVTATQTVQTQQSDQQAINAAMAYAEKFVQTHAGKGYTVAGVYKYALPYYQRKAMPAAPAAPVASLITSSQTVQVKQPQELAMAYAEQFVRTHPGKGYTIPDVLSYALPYYQSHH